MNKNLLNLDLNNHISFKDIPEDDIFSELQYYYIPYDKTEEERDKIQYNNYMYIRNKYDLNHQDFADV